MWRSGSKERRWRASSPVQLPGAQEPWRGKRRRPANLIVHAGGQNRRSSGPAPLSGEGGDPTPLRVPAWVVWLFGIAVVFAYLAMLSHFPLAEPDEPRYAEIAREMIELGDWVTPHLNYVKYFE